MKALIAGMGSIGRRHAANLRALRPGVELKVLTVASALGAALAERPAFALLCTPSATRLEYLLPLLEAGVPCYVEKPLVASLGDARSLRNFVSRSGTSLPVVAVGCNLRLLGSLRHLRESIGRGDIGTVVRASLAAGQWLPDWRPGVDYRRSYSARRASGGGVILDLIHEIDMARWLFGSLDLVHAAAGKFSRLEIESEDTACILLDRKRSAPLVAISLDYVSRRRVRRYEVVGDEGTLVWDLERATLERSDASGTHAVDCAASDFDVAATYVDGLREFLDCLGGGQPSCGIMDGLESAELALRAREKALDCAS